MVVSETLVLHAWPWYTKLAYIARTTFGKRLILLDFGEAVSLPLGSTSPFKRSVAKAVAPKPILGEGRHGPLATARRAS